MLGDTIEQALTQIGITKRRVEQWLGRPCNCVKRQQRLNQLSMWASRVLLGKTQNAEEYLDEILNQPHGDNRA